MRRNDKVYRLYGLERLGDLIGLFECLSRFLAAMARSRQLADVDKDGESVASDGGVRRTPGLKVQARTRQGRDRRAQSEFSPAEFSNDGEVSIGSSPGPQTDS